MPLIEIQILSASSGIRFSCGWPPCVGPLMAEPFSMAAGVALGAT